MSASELHADDLTWDLRPLPDPPMMTSAEMIVEATVDALSYRLLACQALDELHRLTVQADRYREVIAALRARLREGSTS